LAQVKIDKNMPIEKALRKFKSICKKEGIIDEVKKRRAYEKPSSKKRKTDRKNNKPKRPVTRKGRA
jgi:small subunit ribosomal protein S21